MGCVFCKKLETESKQDASLEGDFRDYGAAYRYGPDPTQTRPVSSFNHTANSFSQSTGPTFLDGGTFSGVSGESSGLGAGAAQTQECLGEKEAWNTALYSTCNLREQVRCPRRVPSLRGRQHRFQRGLCCQRTWHPLQ